jgi:hypothetical protein
MNSTHGILYGILDFHIWKSGFPITLLNDEVDRVEICFPLRHQPQCPRFMLLQLSQHSKIDARRFETVDASDD